MSYKSAATTNLTSQTMPKSEENASLQNAEPSLPDSQTKRGVFRVIADPVAATTADEAHKFDLGSTDEPAPAPAPASSAPAYEDLGELPTSYDDEMIFLVARDPRWLFSYWDFDYSKYPASSMRYGYAQFFLRILRTTGHQEALVEINPSARNWYVPVHLPDTDYVAEVGYFDQEGTWRRIAVSPVAHTPPDALAAESHDVDFATVPAHLTFERLLELVQERMAEGETLIAALARVASEGRIEFRPGSMPSWTDQQKRLLAALLGDSLVDQVGLGSDELDQLLRKQLQQRLHSESASGLSLRLLGAELAPSTQSLFSAIGASWSAQPFSIRTERGFFMHVNAEIIFYGGTHPDASVTVNSQSIQLAADGTFRYHFTLPDGDFEIPVVATSPDKVEQRSAILSFKRGTARTGDVGATGQPAGLDPLIGRK